MRQKILLRTTTLVEDDDVKDLGDESPNHSLEDQTKVLMVILSKEILSKNPNVIQEWTIPW